MSRTDISFVAGFDPVSPTPKFATLAGFTHRLAIVQQTYRADSADMYFDEALWTRLLAFAETFAPGADVCVVDRPFSRPRRGEPKPTDEMTLDAYRVAQQGLSERSPAEFVIVRVGDQVRLLIATEFWNEIGGPAPYADSYTYAVFSHDDLAGRLTQFLAFADAAEGWRLASEVQPAPRHKRKY